MIAEQMKIILCHRHEYRYFEEYLKSICGDSLITLYDGSTECFNEIGYYLCIRRVPFNLIPSGSQIGFINTEQLADASKYKEYLTFALDNVEVFDYSEENIKLSGKGKHLPYAINQIETNQLKEYCNVKKEYDIAIVGSPSEYRFKYVQLLRQNGFTVDYITDAFGIERDKRVGKCSIFLNLHYNSTYHDYEPLRCDRWLNAGITMLSEKCNTTIPIISYDSVIDTVASLLGNKTRLRDTGLIMVVKNEQAIIERCLKSVLPYVDTWVIVDTGSTDNTINVINDVAKSMNKPGFLYVRDWKNFGYNRTELLELARQHCKWSLMMDADDWVTNSIPNRTDYPLARGLDDNEPGYLVTIKHYSLTHKRPQLFNSDYKWTYRGALHEYAYCEGYTATKLLDNFHIEARSEGARSKAPLKYSEDARLLLNELGTTSDKARTLFYLAQSYRDAGNKDEAIKYYKQREEFGGWVEEQYVSCLNIIRLSDTYDEKLKYCLKAQQYIPKRREAIFDFMSWCRRKNQFTEAVYALGSLYAKETVHEGLFIETVPQWTYYDELSIIAYYTGRYHKSLKYATLALNDCDNMHRDRIKMNISVSDAKLNI